MKILTPFLLYTFGYEDMRFKWLFAYTLKVINELITVIDVVDNIFLYFAV